MFILRRCWRARGPYFFFLPPDERLLPVELFERVAERDELRLFDEFDFDALERDRVVPLVDPLERDFVEPLRELLERFDPEDDFFFVGVAAAGAAGVAGGALAAAVRVRPP